MDAGVVSGEAVATLPIAAGVCTLALAAVHILVGRRRGTAEGRVAGGLEDRRLLSVAAGAAVSYVFVILLPEVSEAAVFVAERGADPLDPTRVLLAEQAVYVLALVGFVTFYGVEIGARNRLSPESGSSMLFRAHVTVFALYSGVVAYLLFNREVPGLVDLALYALAMALHFAVTDEGMRRHHGVAFERSGRWVLAAGTVLGGVVGAVVRLDGLGLAMVFGFLAGAVVLNVIKEELPTAGEGRFVAFVLGAVAYASLALAV